MTCNEANLDIDLQQDALRWHQQFWRGGRVGFARVMEHQVHSKVVGLPRPGRRVTMVISFPRYYMTREGVYRW